MKKVVIPIIVAVAVMISYLTGCLWTKPEAYTRNRTVKLISGHATCSGEQVRAPSGESFILTAGHCHGLADKDGNITVITEDGNALVRKVIAEDKFSDLLLLEGIPGLRGIPLASWYYRNEEVKTFTHGSGFDTYKTEGVLINKKFVEPIMGIIVSPEDQAACDAMPNKFITKEIDFFGIATIKVCLMHVEEMAMTAFIAPGSSGGMVVDSSGDLVGVVSCSDEKYGYIIPLESVTKFLAGY